MTRKIELTLHLRGASAAEHLHATADLFYQDTPADDDLGEGETVELPERKRVDMATTSFDVPAD
jgi:hypothetical protein